MIEALKAEAPQSGGLWRSEDRLAALSHLPDETADLILARPDKRAFLGGRCAPDEMFRMTADQLARLLKPGGVLAWHVRNDRGAATFSTVPFRQVLYFQAIKLYSYDTILVKKDVPPSYMPLRYADAFESMYICSKEKTRPKTCNMLRDKPNKWAGTKTWGTLTKREVDGTLTRKKQKTIQKVGVRTNVWSYGDVLPIESELFGGEPASLSERLAEDVIRTWTNAGDLVLAPFGSSKTISQIARLLGRRWMSIYEGEAIV